jgi:enolase
MSEIQRVSAREFLDSRGRPTVWAACELAGGAHGAVSVPSGASTGKAEALELRDGEKNRYGGLGCRRAVANVNGPIHAALAGRSFAAQQELDTALTALDGTPNKSNLGANALLAVSLAFARASAAASGKPLYEQFAEIAGPEITGPAAMKPATLPRMTINLFSGGKHAGGQVCIQDVLVVPAAARTVDEGLAVTYAVYQAAARLTQEKYGARALKADEGGLAPPFPTTEAMLADAVEAIRRAGFAPGRDVALAVDVASSHFYEPESGKYIFDGRPLSSAEMIALVAGWLDKYPIVSLEDALSEEDWPNWPALRTALGNRALTLGDDFLCTNPARIKRAIDAGCCNALLLKVNQIGTLSEAAESLRLARAAGWRVTVSARSGETEDDWLADLSVGWRGDQLKVGSIAGGERLAKYNRLLAIEAETEWPVVAWPI